MIEATRFLCLIIMVISLIAIMAGMYKPVLVLWFLDRMNRLMVLKYYGQATIGAGFFWFLLGLIQ
jgi:hypothetical protein